MYENGRFGPHFWKNEGVQSPDILIREHALKALEGRNVVITGGTGKIGSVLTDFFSRPGTINTRSVSLTSHPDNPARESLHGDLADPAFAAIALNGADVLIHTAAITDTFLCQSDPVGAIRENVAMANNVAEAARRSGTKLAILTSGLMATETAISSQPTVYGKSKQLAEQVWKTYAAVSHHEDNGSGTRFVVARLGSVSEADNRLGLWDKFYEQARRKGHINVFGIGSERRMMAMDQVVDLLCFAIAEELAENGSIVMRSDMPRVTALDLARDIADHHREEDIPERPDIILTSPHPAVRPADNMFCEGEEERALGIGDTVLIPPPWKAVEPNVHLSYPVKGQKAVLFEGKIPGVIRLEGLRGVTPEKPVGDYPHTLEFCPVAACNFGCPACSYAERNAGGADHQRPPSLSRETAFSLLDTLKQRSAINRDQFARANPGNEEILRVIGNGEKNPVPGIFIAGWGEPTLSPWLSDFIVKAGESFPVGLCTNASMLETSGVATPQVLSHLNLLMWSLYAADEQSFHETAMSRVPGRNRNYFHQVENGIRKALEIRNRENLDFKFAIKILLNRRNFPMIMQMYNYAASFNPDRLVIRLANNFEPGQDVELTPFDRHILQRLIMDSTALDPQHPLRRFARIFLGEGSDKPYVPRWGDDCHNVRDGQFAMIDPDGNVHLSVITDGNRRRSIGNINEGNWEEIWGGPEHGRQVKIASYEYTRHICGAKGGGCRHADASNATERLLHLASDENHATPFMPLSFLANDGPFI